MIEVGTDYRVGADADNIIVYRRTKPKSDGKTNWRAEAYFGTVGEAMHHLVGIGVRSTGLDSLKAVSDKIDELHRLIDGLGLPDRAS